MKHRSKILYIEDETSLGKIVSDTLGKQGYDVLWETEGGKVLTLFESFTPDICVLDIMLPGIDGYSLCRTIKARHPYLPVIFLTAKTGTSDIVSGFEAGGTDYIKKPFSIEELIIRIENQLNLRDRNFRETLNSDKIKIGAFTCDTVTYELITPSTVIRLSNRDMQVLKMLYANRNSVTPRKDLLINIWGDDSYFNSRTLDVYVRKLRKFFEEDNSIQIITLKSSGYLFLVP